MIFLCISLTHSASIHSGPRILMSIDITSSTSLRVLCVHLSHYGCSLDTTTPPRRTKRSRLSSPHRGGETPKSHEKTRSGISTAALIFAQRHPAAHSEYHRKGHPVDQSRYCSSVRIPSSRTLDVPHPSSIGHWRHMEADSGGVSQQTSDLEDRLVIIRPLTATFQLYSVRGTYWPLPLPPTATYSCP
jgi:hypothetical protein